MYIYPLSSSSTFYYASTNPIRGVRQATAANPAGAQRVEAVSAIRANSRETIVDELEWSDAALAILKAPPLAGSQQVVATSMEKASAELTVEPAPDAARPADGENQVPDSVRSNVAANSAKEEAKAEPTDAENVGTEEQLTPEEQEQVKQLADRDREVRTHEQAHLAAAGPYARGGPTYTFQQGPDGKQYAIGGEVQIDTAPVSGDPEATIRKAQVVRAAALAPAEPSSQDRAVAAAATQMQQAAQAQLMQQRLEDSTGQQEGESLQHRSANYQQRSFTVSKFDAWA